jgi:hypothetical protein
LDERQKRKQRISNIEHEISNHEGTATAKTHTLAPAKPGLQSVAPKRRNFSENREKTGRENHCVRGGKEVKFRLVLWSQLTSWRLPAKHGRTSRPWHSFWMKDEEYLGRDYSATEQ